MPDSSRVTALGTRRSVPAKGLLRARGRNASLGVKLLAWLKSITRDGLDTQGSSISSRVMEFHHAK